MKKIIPLFLLTLIFITKAKAQTVSDTTLKKGFVGFSIGPSFPYRDFASATLNNKDAGFAKVGLSVNFSFGYRFGKHFGIAAMTSGTVNSFDEDAYGDYVPGVLISSTAWKASAFMAGGYYTSTANKTTFEMRLMIGYTSIALPEITATGYDTSGVLTIITQPSKKSGTVCSDFGVGLKSSLSENISLIAFLDFLSAEPEFNNVQLFKNNTLLSTTSGKQTYTTINITIGIAFNLK